MENNNNKSTSNYDTALNIFNFIKNDIYVQKMHEGFELLNNFKIILSLQLSGLTSDIPDKGINVIYSSVYYVGPISSGLIRDKLSSKLYSNDLHIVNVSWTKTRDIDNLDVVDIDEYVYRNIHDCQYKLFIYNMSYVNFFNNINNISALLSNII